jgi:hypothetical protein
MCMSMEQWNKYKHQQMLRQLEYLREKEEQEALREKEVIAGLEQEISETWDELDTVKTRNSQGFDMDLPEEDHRTQRLLQTVKR